ncbi:trehalose-phosphatase [Brevibacterium litoralis]|uniref:trehalose-phosphatase n=1 Tax=Brevibacterium litoralis TaxID=3138935 RepID=UPI0032ED3829
MGEAVSDRQHLHPPVRAAAEVDLSTLVGARRLLVALDFDGVVAPLQDDPETSAPLPTTARAIEALVALPDTVVGFLSGRPLEVLRRLARAPHGAVFIGSHGAEEDFSGLARSTGNAGGTAGTETVRSADAADEAPSPAEQDMLDRLDAGFDRIASAAPADGEGDLRLEDKPLGRTFHLRGVTGERREYFEQAVDALADQVPEARHLHGNEVIEYAVRTHTKADGLEHMARVVGADALVFLGDDRTDEDAFALIRESERTRGSGASAVLPPAVGIKVGEADTVAPTRIADPAAVGALLTRLAAERAAAHSTP